ncbi:relaxase/mobilization nuclease domain-containing protein [Neptunicoccus sediminis]|uniref:relaxase/mobilization nuclease domain-containing protein n=1 Tax=Neptunicoccus sediminis TaxID=1892596 RepID=UPI000845C5CD|nr:relaxase/mobilization nuclease domain-containing protein [Neptunicoccus sediminis]
MAIGNLTKGGSAAGLVEYLLAEHDNKGEIRHRADIVGGTLGFEEDAAKIHLDAFKNLRPSLNRNMVHLSISLTQEDRKLSDHEWAQIGDLWAERMGFEGYMTVCHGDHIHIAASRIRLDGSVVSDSHDYRRSEAVIREIEERFDLVRVEPSHLLDPDKARDHIAAPKRGEFEMAHRGVISTKSQLQGLLKDLTSAPITATDFVEALEACGVDVRPNVSETTGRLSGFSFGLEGHHISASKLGRSFTLKNLTERGFSYEPDRDFPAVVTAKERSLGRATTGGIGTDPRLEHTDASADRRDARADGASVAPDTQVIASGREDLPNTEGKHGPDPAGHKGTSETPIGNTQAAENPKQSDQQTGKGDAIGSAQAADSADRPRDTPAGDAGHAHSVLDWSFLDGDGWEALFRFFKNWSRSIKAAMGRPQKPLPVPPPLTPANRPQWPTQDAPDHRKRSNERPKHEFDLPAQEAPSADNVSKEEVIDDFENIFEHEELAPDDENETGPAFGP